jgi:[ribosomal protein S5]-alanine N-acetyltransferase
VIPKEPGSNVLVLDTSRLHLRHARDDDAARFVEILSNWNVIKMLRLAPHPYTRADAETWIASHADERQAGTAHRFVIERDGRIIGTCDVDEIAGSTGDLGYWLDEAAWGRGYATEAARAVLDFSFGQLALTRVTSGHAADNPNSGHILTKLGFIRTGQTRTWSNPRGGEIDQLKYELRRTG